MYLWQIYSIFALNIYLNTSYKTTALSIYQERFFDVICTAVLLADKVIASFGLEN